MTFSAELSKQNQQIQSFSHVMEILGKPRSFEVDQRKLWLRLTKGSVRVTLYPGEVIYSLSVGDTLFLEIPPSHSSEAHLILIEPDESEAQIEFQQSH